MSEKVWGSLRVILHKTALLSRRILKIEDPVALVLLGRMVSDGASYEDKSTGNHTICIHRKIGIATLYT
jgi:hypothetical protein